METTMSSSSTSSFVAPSPLLRFAARPVLQSSRTLLTAKLSQQPSSSDSVARLRQLKHNVKQRYLSVQSSPEVTSENAPNNSRKGSKPTPQKQASTSTPKSKSTSVSTSTSTSASTSTSTSAPAPASAPASASASSTSISSSSILTPNDVITSKSNVKSKTPVILRYDAFLPWKSKSTRSKNPFPPVETYLPHVDVFSKHGQPPPPYIVTPEEQYYQSISSGNSQMPPEPAMEQLNEKAQEILSGLNEQQREAVVADVNRACLVLAGPGSGKTRVLTHRIAYLIKAKGVSPSSVLAVTFTNKAASEMRERVESILHEHHMEQDYGFNSKLTIGTFHWVCTRFLRSYGEHMGLSTDFDICDSQDARNIISRILSASASSESETGKTVDAAQISMSVSLISKLKNDKEDELRKRMPRFMNRILNLRKAYDDKLRSMNMLDFDDLLVQTRRMLNECPNIRQLLQNRYQYVLVDEWQDTNNVQFDIVSLLTQMRKNLFVVGDVDQSIYKFRGADSGNIFRYSQMFNNTKQIMLVQNYRSTGNIISAAKAVIDQDKNRPKKDMVTTNKVGEKVNIISCSDGRLEAQSVVSSIVKLKKANKILSFSDCAIMYRTNSQSRLLEEVCVQSDIPYLLQSGTRFFERKEVKDIIAYLKIVHNPSDDNAVLRVINVPTRGIGKRTVDRIESYAQLSGKPMYQTIVDMIDDESMAAEAGIRPSELQKVSSFNRLVEHMADEISQVQSATNQQDRHVGNVLTSIIRATDYEEYLRSSGENEKDNKAQDRLDNIEELVRSGTKHEEVKMFLERVTLMTEAGNKNDERQDRGDGAIWLTTLHGSKGLEFDAVFISGAEDGIIPLMRDGSVEDIEEERRLLYVGMTRAKKYLTISWRSQRYSKESKVTKKLNMSRFLSKVSGLETKDIQRNFKKFVKKRPQ